MKTLKIFLFSTFVAASSISGHGQTAPSLINYQGKLTDASGNPLPNGTYGVAFRIWTKKSSSESGNVLVWGQEYNVTLLGGVFNVILGAPGGTPIVNAAVNDIGFAFAEWERYLGVTVSRGTNGAAITGAMEILPRQQFLPVPLALQAAQSAFAALATNALLAARASVADTATNVTDGIISMAKLAPALAAMVAGAKISSVQSYGTSLASGSPVNESDLKLCYGTAPMTGSQYATVSGLPFTSSSSYTVVACRNANSAGPGGYATQAVVAHKVSGSQFALADFTPDSPINWIAIGY